MKEYIVTERQIMQGVRFALERSISDSKIVDLLMRPIIEEIETILEDDCEEMTEEMWNSMMV